MASSLPPEVNQLFSSLTIKIVFLVLGLPILREIIRGFKSPKQKGKRGEGLVNFSMKLHLDPKIYHLIPDVTLPAGSGTTQIDHIVVSVYGVFVIETKNMKGWIFGDENQPRWTQTNFKKKNSFQNPLHQNYKHVKTLEKLLGLKNDQLHSIVVFMGESKFKTRMPENVVWGGGACARYIKSKTDRVLNARDVSKIIAQIESGRLAQGKQTDQLHIHHVRTSDRVMPLDLPTAVENACPKCASPMILRTAKRGAYAGDQFWGCSRYPGCRGTRKCTSGGVEG